jgi:citrate synthase
MSEKEQQPAQITLDGTTYSLPVIVGTENEKAIDITKLRDQTGYITLDSGYKNTGATTSAVTFLDGEEGILRYRGYPIEQLAEKSTFTEVSYLLVYGKLPTKTELEKFNSDISRHTLVHEDMKRFYEAYPSKAHPMGVVASVVCSLSTFYPENNKTKRTSAEIDLTVHRVLAKFPTIAAWAYKNSIGHPIMYPKNSHNYVENFLYMMFANPSEEYEIDPVVANALDKLLILHADHEQNCSASTVRMVGSSKANLYASIAAGTIALWGPLHGGANQ